jgi:pyruvate formate lyase activating enzyme
VTADLELSLDDPFMVPTRWWHRLDDGRVQCDVCPRACRLHEGQRGLCFVRARVADQVVLTSYGRSSGFCVDPVEKKPLNHFLPGSAALSFGTAGCNLACKFCQNWDISKSREIDTLADAASPQALAAVAERAGCRSVAFTYNDPVIFWEYAADVADACHESGIKAIAVTAGYMNPGPREEFYRHIDAANVDLKAFTEEFYHRTCAAHLADVLDTLRYLRHETDVWLEITTLLIPGRNDSDAEIEAECAWILDNLGPDVPLHFTAFHPDYKMTDVPPTPPATLTRAREIALRHGLRYVYTGNVHDTDGGSTFCPGCGRGWWCATGTGWSATSSPTPAPARPAAPRSPGCTTAPPATGARAGCHCSSAAEPRIQRAAAASRRLFSLSTATAMSWTSRVCQRS